MEEITVNLTPEYLVDMMENQYGLTVDQFSIMSTEREELIERGFLKERSLRKIFNSTSEPSTSDDEEITVSITPQSCYEMVESIYGDPRIFHYLSQAHEERLGHEFPKLFGHLKKPDGPVVVAPPMPTANPKKPLRLPGFLLMENLSPFFSRRQFYDIWVQTDAVPWEEGDRGLAMMDLLREVTNFDTLSVEHQKSVLYAAKKYKDCFVAASRMLDEKRALEKAQRENESAGAPMETD